MSTKTNKITTVFGRRLAALRKEKHLTQPELADRVGMTRQMISYLEIRAENPTMEQIKKFADFFSVSADEFIYENIGREPRSNLERQIEKLKKLPKAQRKLVSDMIEAAVKAS